MALKAVTTGDIVNFTKLSAGEEKKLLHLLATVLEPHQSQFYRGDSFQVYHNNPRDALKTALLCRAAAISLSQGKKAIPSDIRLSIGIGQAKKPTTTLGAAQDEAFILSGRAFDAMNEKNSRLLISSANELANAGLQVIADYINGIFNEMTAKQASVIFELLNGQTQQAAAINLKKSKSTIHQHASAGRWPEIERLLQQFDNIINHLI
jgi:hypothetical protein